MHWLVGNSDNYQSENCSLVRWLTKSSWKRKKYKKFIKTARTITHFLYLSFINIDNLPQNFVQFFQTTAVIEINTIFWRVLQCCVQKRNLLLLETKIRHHNRKINLWDKLSKENSRYFFCFSSYIKLKLHLFLIFQSHCIPFLKAHSKEIIKEYKIYLLSCR